MCRDPAYDDQKYAQAVFSAEREAQIMNGAGKAIPHGATSADLSQRDGRRIGAHTPTARNHEHELALGRLPL
jgi:hypothetical protein